MQENVKAKWDVTDEAFKQTAEELCEKGVRKGCFQNMNALLALFDLISAGDIAEPKGKRGGLMKLKNVLRALLEEYSLEEINIIGKNRVIFSGTPSAWKEPSVDMLLYKKMVESAEVINRIIFNNRKAFIFVAID